MCTSKRVAEGQGIYKNLTRVDRTWLRSCKTRQAPLIAQGFSKGKPNSTGKEDRRTVFNSWLCVNCSTINRINDAQRGARDYPQLPVYHCPRLGVPIQLRKPMSICNLLIKAIHQPSVSWLGYCVPVGGQRWCHQGYVERTKYPEGVTDLEILIITGYKMEKADD